MAVVKRRRAARASRISAKNQVTIPVSELGRAGLKAGDRVRIEAAGVGQVRLTRLEDAIERYSGIFTGLYPKDYLKKLRDEWH